MSKAAADHDSSTTYKERRFSSWEEKQRKPILCKNRAVNHNNSDLWGVQTQGYRSGGDGFVYPPTELPSEGALVLGSRHGKGGSVIVLQSFTPL